MYRHSADLERRKFSRNRNVKSNKKDRSLQSLASDLSQYTFPSVTNLLRYEDQLQLKIRSQSLAPTQKRSNRQNWTLAPHSSLWRRSFNLVPSRTEKRFYLNVGKSLACSAFRGHYTFPVVPFRTCNTVWERRTFSSWPNSPIASWHLFPRLSSLCQATIRMDSHCDLEAWCT